MIILKKILNLIFITIPCIFLFPFVCDAASVTGYGTIDNVDLPVTKEVSKNITLYTFNSMVHSNFNSFMYASLDICSNVGLRFEAISSSGDYNFNSLVNIGSSCSVNGYSGSLYRLYLKVKQWDIGSGSTNYYLADTSFSLASTYDYNGYVKFDNLLFMDDSGFNESSSNNEVLDAVNKITIDMNNAINSVLNDINNSNTEINNNINNATNDINNNINDMNTNINNNIDDLKNKQDETNNAINSEDDDVSSNKCGILCKLKSLVFHITHLPSTIWNLFKEGFDFIVNSITSLWNGIKDLFTPPKECTTSANLFDFSSMYFMASSGVENNESSVTIPPNGYVEYNLGLATDFDTSKDLWINVEDFCSNCNSTIQFYSIKNGGLWTSAFSTNNTSFPWRLNDKLPSAGSRNLIFTLRNYSDSNITIEKVMLNYGSSSFSYQPYGEVCSGGGSLFDWFGNFFSKLFDGIMNLPSMIFDGLRSLFVPTDAQLYEILDDSSKLTENFGFVGEAMNFFLGIFTSLLGLVNANGCVELPEFTIGATSLFDAHTFWNAQQVCLGDNAILSNNIATIRTITSIALVCLFVNFASRKFFDILNKTETPEQDAFGIMLNR